MTLTELKEWVAESENNEWYQKYQLTLNYPVVNFKATFNGVVSIYEFILTQLDGFNDIQNLPQELISLKSNFFEAKQRFDSLINNKSNNKAQWDADLDLISNNNPLKFLYNSPEVELLVQANTANPTYASAVYGYFTGNTQYASNRDYFIGYVLAYEFTAKNNSGLVNRIISEQKSIESIRNDFQDKLVESESLQVDYLARVNKKYNEYEDGLDKLFRKTETDYKSWFQTTNDEFNKFNTDSGNTVKELENLYREKLKLEAPAQYWKDRATKLSKEGYGWLFALIGSLVAAVTILFLSLHLISNGMLIKIFDNTATSIKWSIVFITIVSFLAFAIKIFSKLTFSAFHLARDAEEREQLTYVYLALKKEQGIDETERHLIMQSLFSRADTGLLKDDSSPTMPGGIAEKMMGK